MGRVGSGLAGLKFYDSNPTRPTIKKIFVTQPNPPRPKNRPNQAGWVGSGWFWQVGCTPPVLVKFSYSFD